MVIGDNEVCANLGEEYQHSEDPQQNNLRMKCNDENRILPATEESPAFICSDKQVDGVFPSFCTGPDVNGITHCTGTSSCSIDDTDAWPFGLYYREDSCYYNEDRDREYCYIDTYTEGPDRGSYIVDQCIPCDPEGSCLDYHSQQACKDDWCNYNNLHSFDCAWIANDYGALGKGYCVYEGYDKEDYCSTCADPNIGLFEECTSEICQALGACLVDGDDCIGCGNSGCEDLTKNQCGGTTPITYERYAACGNTDVDAWQDVEYNDDTCGIGVCYYNLQAATCRHDADGDGEDECDTPRCERDGEPPVTEITQQPEYIGMGDFEITLEITDNMFPSGDLFYCFAKDDCCPENSAAFGEGAINPDEPQEVTIRFPEDIDQSQYIDAPGAYHLVFFSKEDNHNVELVKQGMPISVDVTPPSITITADWYHDLDDPSGEHSFIYFGYSTEDTADTECRHRLTPPPANFPLTYNNADDNSWIFDPVRVTDDSYILEVECRDIPFGNIARELVIINVDRYHNIEINYPLLEAIRESNPLLNLTTSDEDNCKITEVTHGNNNPYHGFVDEEFSPEGYAIGDHTLEVMLEPNLYYHFSVLCQNEFGKQDSGSFHFTVDNTPPVSGATFRAEGVKNLNTNENGFEYRSKNRVTVTLVADDPFIDNSPDVPFIFGVKEIQYCRAPDFSYCDEGLQTLNTYTAPFPVESSTWLCVRAVDNGNNVEEGFCGFIRFDTQAPVIDLESPPLPFVTHQDTFQVSGIASDNDPDGNIDVAVEIINPDGTVQSVSLDVDARGNFDDAVGTLSIEEEDGENSMRVVAADLAGNPGYFPVDGSFSKVYLDLFGPVITAAGYDHLDREIMDKRNPAEYGQEIRFNAVVVDTQYTVEDSSEQNAVIVSIIDINEEEVDGTITQMLCDGQHVGDGHCEWEAIITPAQSGSIYNLEVGNYTAVFEGIDRFGNENTASFEFIIRDNQGPAFAISIGEPYPSDGFAYGGVSYPITIVGDEPLSNDTPELAFACRGAFLPVSVEEKTDPYTWEGTLSVDDCDEFHGESYFHISGYDKHDIEGTEVLEPNAFLIDTEGPGQPRLLYPLEDEFVSATPVLIEGTADPEHVVYIKVFDKDNLDGGESYHVDAVMSSPSVTAETGMTAGEALFAGATTIRVDGDYSAYVNYYLEVDRVEHKIPHYFILDADYFEVSDYTLIDLGEPLRQDVPRGGALSIFSDALPSGYFSTAINAVPLGRSVAIAYAEDAFGNEGPQSEPRYFTYDPNDPVVDILSPLDETYTGDIIKYIALRVRDDESGILIESVNLTFNGQSYSYMQLHGHQGEDGWHYLNLSPLHLVDGVFSVVFRATDMAGNEVYIGWEFTVDPDATHDPDFSIDEGFEFTRWYVNQSNFNGELVYSDEQVQITRDFLEPQHLVPGTSPTGENTFDVSFAGVQENPDVGAAWHEFLIYSQKWLFDDGMWGPESLHTKHITVDTTLPELEINYRTGTNRFIVPINGTVTDFTLDNEGPHEEHAYVNNVIVSWFDSAAPQGDQHRSAAAGIGVKQQGTSPWEALIYLVPVAQEREIPFTVTACDKAGNCRAESHSFMYDLTPPKIVAIAHGGIVSENPTELEMQTDEASYCRWSFGRINGYAYLEHQFSGGEGTLFHLTNITLVEGKHNYSLSCKDAAGNPMLVSNKTEIELDTTGPEFSNPLPAEDSTVYYPGEVSVGASDPQGVLESSLLMLIDDTDVSDELDYVDGRIVYEMPTLGLGLHTVYAYAEDFIGNLNDYEWSFIIDQSIPSMPVYMLDSVVIDATANPMPQITADFSPQEVLVHGYRLRDENIPLSFQNVINQRFRFLPESPLGEGFHTFEIEASLLGGTGGIGEYYFRFTVDTEGPEGYDPYCGNVYIDQGESCDEDLGPVDHCSDLGFDGGPIGCYPPGHPRECHFNTEQCLGSEGVCGDGVVDSGESCDITSPISDCAMLDDFIGGGLECYPPGHAMACHFNTESCVKETVALVSSPTHPDQSRAYANDDPVLEWRFSDISGMRGYSYLFDQEENSEPDEDEQTNSGGRFTIESTKTFTNTAEGDHWFHIKAEDMVGNWGPSHHYAIHIDTTPPLIEIQGPEYTVENPVEIAVITDDTAINATVYLNADMLDVLLVEESVFTLNIPLIENQANYISVEVSDETGNDAMSNELRVMHDNFAPVLVYSNPVNTTRHSEVDRIKVVIDEEGSGLEIARIDVTRGGTVVEGETVSALLEGTENIIVFTPLVPFTEQGLDVESYHASVLAKDYAGNTGHFDISFTIDKNAPKINISQPKEILNYVNDQEQLFGGTIVSSDTITSVKIDGEEIIGTAFWQNGEFLKDIMLFVEGERRDIAITATDSSGDWARDIRTFLLDVTAPNVTLEVISPTPAYSQRIRGSFSDNARITVSGIQVIVTNGLGSEHVSAFSDGQGVYAAHVDLVEGFNTITVIASDKAGNNATIQKDILVKTTVAEPVIFAMPRYTNKPVNISGVSELGTLVELWINEEKHGVTEITETSPPLTIPLTQPFLREDTVSSGTPVRFENTFDIDITLWADFIGGSIELAPGEHHQEVMTEVRPWAYHFAGAGIPQQNGLLIVEERQGYFTFGMTDLADLGLESGDTAEIFVRAIDLADNSRDSSVHEVTYDNEAPELSNLHPGDGDILSETGVMISANIYDFVSGVDFSAVQLWVDGNRRNYVREGGHIRYFLNLDQGQHTVGLLGRDRAENPFEKDWGFSINDAVPDSPDISFEDGFIFEEQQYVSMPNPLITVTFPAPVENVQAAITSPLTLIGQNGNSYAYATDPMSDGVHLVTVIARLPGGPSGQWSEDFVIDLTKPVIDVKAPQRTRHLAPGLNLTANEIIDEAAVSGDVLPETIAIGDSAATFHPTLLGTDGQKTIDVQGFDIVGRSSNMKSVMTVLDRSPPVGVIEILDAEGSLTRSPRPEILVSFDEPVSIITANISRQNMSVAVAQTFSDEEHMLFRFKPTVDLGEGLHTFRVIAQDLAGNNGSSEQDFRVNLSFELWLVYPPYGVSPTRVFDISLGSSTEAVCRYDYYSQQPYEAYDYGFDITGDTLHTIKDYDISDGSTIFVSCNSTAGKVSDAMRFDFGVDETAPSIERLYALPNPVAQYTNVSGLWLLKSTLHVETDEDTLCRFNNGTSREYENMLNQFQGGFGQDHVRELVFTSERNYTFFVACQNRALLASAIRDLVIVVDTTLPLMADFVEIGATSQSTVELVAGTNKDAICAFKNDSGHQIGTTDWGTEHRQYVSGLVQGSYTFHINCSRNFERADDTMTFIVDRTAPGLQVNDTSDDHANPGKSWRTDKLRVWWDAEDNETGIRSTAYRLIDSGSDVIVDWTADNHNKEWVWVEEDQKGDPLNLSNGETYYFWVNATNDVGLSIAKRSDGIIIDTSLTPPENPSCSDNRENQGESDIDCGGPCPGCDLDDRCDDDTDCLSEFCNDDDVCEVHFCDNNQTDKDEGETDRDCGGSCDGCSLGDDCEEDEDCKSDFCSEDGLCEEPSCSDGEANGDESDVDCGGSCPECEDDSICRVDEDCLSGWCHEDDYVCDEPTCSDGYLNPDESDTDCGGSCPGCEEGRHCLVHADCASDNCAAGYCVQGDEDTDLDGMPDWWELQYGTDPYRDDADEDPDEDGYTNIEEYYNGTDPHQLDDYGPPPKPKVWSIILLFLGILVVLSAIGYFVYTNYIKKPKRPMYRPSMQGPVGMGRPMPRPGQRVQSQTMVNRVKKKLGDLVENRHKMFSAFDSAVEGKGMKKIPLKGGKSEGVKSPKTTTKTKKAKSGTPRVVKDKWIDVQDVGKRRKKDVFEKLEKITEKHEQKKALEKTPSDDVFEKLEKIAKKDSKKK
ncbi:MAG: hypothetical protein ABIH34_03300 [Nanoarchaeota archaeon]